MEIGSGIWFVENTEAGVIIEVQGHREAEGAMKKWAYVAEIKGIDDSGQLNRNFLRSAAWTEWKNAKWYLQHGDHTFHLDFGKIYEVQPRVESIYKRYPDVAHRKYLRFVSADNADGAEVEFLTASKVLKFAKSRPIPSEKVEITPEVPELIQVADFAPVDSKATTATTPQTKLEENEGEGRGRSIFGGKKKK